MSAQCTVCEDSPRASGVLCESCIERIQRTEHLCPEQITSRRAMLDADAPSAWLIDTFGNVHHLAASTLLGRATESSIAISFPSVSKRHAQIVHRDAGWYVNDCGSQNGTSLNAAPVDRRFRLDDNDVVFLGPHVGFYFRTWTTSEAKGFSSVREVLRDPPEWVTEVDLPLPSERGVLLSAASGGGGIASWGDQRLQLTELELALLFLLQCRRRKEHELPEETRGYIRSSELLASGLPFEVRSGPTHNNLRGLVRRIRDKTERAGWPNLVEGRQNMGYRLADVDAAPSGHT